MENSRRPFNSFRHGHASAGKPSPTYVSWQAMLSRCFNPNTNRYKHYGARGISVCQRWRESFPAFLSDMGERPAGRSLDRIDTDGNYEPGNCRWATKIEQRANQRPISCFPDRRGRKLVRADAAGIKKLLRTKALLHREIASLFSLSTSTVSSISRGELWSRVP